MDNENNRWQMEIEHEREVAQRTKKRVLIAIVICFGVLVLLGGTVWLLESVADRDTTGTETDAPLYFYPSDPDVNILEDDDYLSLDRRIYFTRAGETTVVTEENIASYGSAVQALRWMIDCIVAGDSEGYNACFSSHYYATKGNEAKEDFTMQRVYDIELEFVRESVQTDKSGNSYTQYEIIVKYKIDRNDGTFRRDIGSNEARKQYYVLSDSTGSRVLIDQIMNYNYSGVKG